MRQIFLSEEKRILELIKTLLLESLSEIKQYKQTKNEVFIIQAGEKAHNAITNVAYILNKGRIKSHEDVRRFWETSTRINKSTGYEIIALSDFLHSNFYNNFATLEQVESKVLRLKNIIENILKRL